MHLKPPLHTTQHARKVALVLACFSSQVSCLQLQRCCITRTHLFKKNKPKSIHSCGKKRKKWWKFCTLCRLDITPAFSPACVLCYSKQTNRTALKQGTLAPAIFRATTEHVHVPDLASAFQRSETAHLRMFYSWQKAATSHVSYSSN